MNQINQTNKLSRYSRRLGFTAALLLCAGLATAPAIASSVPITFTFTGTVSKVGDKLSGGTFSHGQSVTGSYTFESTTDDNNDSPYIGEYKDALTNLNVTIWSPLPYKASLGLGHNEIEVKNPSGLRHDSYEVEGELSRDGDKVNGYKPNSFELELEHLKHSSTYRFDRDLLPSTPPSVSSFKESTLRLVFGYGGYDKTVTIKVHDMTFVPLPPAVLLFGAGFVALIGLGARNRQREARARQA